MGPGLNDDTPDLELMLYRVDNLGGLGSMKREHK
jgi:hypothetical protein